MNLRKHVKPIVLTALSLLIFANHLASAAPPKRVLYLVFDHMRPDYIDRYDLKNFKKLRAQSQWYSNAAVGFIGAETIVSHLVFSTGLEPRQMPWQDEHMIDEKGEFGPKNAIVLAGALSLEQLLKLTKETVAQPLFLSSSLKPMGKIFSVGQKHYAAAAFGGPYADGIVTLNKENGVCKPTGFQVPKTILENKRFEIDCNKDYGTADLWYPLDGKAVAGDDKEHMGGDTWVADAGLEIMRHENWSGLFLTFAAIDKLAHQTGAHDGKSLAEHETQYTLEGVIKTADEQLGRLMEELKNQKLDQDTLIVVTADHGGQPNTHYLGKGKSEKAAAKADLKSGGKETLLPHQTPENLKAQSIFSSLEKLDGVWRVFADSTLRVWGKSLSKTTQMQIEKQSKEFPGVLQIYKLNPKGVAQYNLVWTNPTQKKTEWLTKRVPAFLKASANKNAPAYYITFQDGYGFDLLGDHGGVQEKVQRIPLLILNPNQKPKEHKQPVGLPEVKNLILQALAVK